MATQQAMTYFSELLIFHKIMNAQEVLTDDSFEDHIEQFQAKEGLLVDGIVGPETLWHLQELYARQSTKLPFVKCVADIEPGGEGFDSLELRQGAAEKFNLLRKEISDLGGLVTTAGGKRALTAGVGANRSAKSMHYTGLAFDLATTSGFFNPSKDPFILTRTNSGSNYWTLWSRASGGKDMELDAVHWKNWNSGKDLTKKIKGHFVNFTQACKRHGFHPISPRRSFTRSTDRNYLGSEWWHFQANDLLIPQISQFGIELLKIEGYTQEFIESQNSNIWGNRKSVYKKTWF